MRTGTPAPAGKARASAPCTSTCAPSSVPPRGFGICGRADEPPQRTLLADDRREVVVEVGEQMAFPLAHEPAVVAAFAKDADERRHVDRRIVAVLVALEGLRVGMDDPWDERRPALRRLMAEQGSRAPREREGLRIAELGDSCDEFAADRCHVLFTRVRA